MVILIMVQLAPKLPLLIYECQYLPNWSQRQWARQHRPGRKVSRRTRRCHKLQSYYHPFCIDYFGLYHRSVMTPNMFPDFYQFPLAYITLAPFQFRHRPFQLPAPIQDSKLLNYLLVTVLPAFIL